MLIPTRSGRYYIRLIQENFVKIFSLKPHERLNIKESYPLDTFKKRKNLFEQLGVIRASKSWTYSPPNN
jgi:hypothetical protein